MVSLILVENCLIAGLVTFKDSHFLNGITKLDSSASLMLALDIFGNINLVAWLNSEFPLESEKLKILTIPEPFLFESANEIVASDQTSHSHEQIIDSQTIAPVQKLVTLGEKLWYCQECTTGNKSEVIKCVACNAPKPGVAVSTSIQPTFGLTVPSLLGLNSWNCKECTTSNKSEVLKCVACEAPKPGVAVSTSIQPTFGLTVPSLLGLNSWNCKECTTSNKSEVLKCVACEAPKDIVFNKPSTSSNILNTFGSTSSNATTTFSIPTIPNFVPTVNFSASQASSFVFKAPDSKMESKSDGFKFNPKLEFSKPELPEVVAPSFSVQLLKAESAISSNDIKNISSEIVSVSNIKPDINVSSGLQDVFKDFENDINSKLAAITKSLSKMESMLPNNVKKISNTSSFPNKELEDQYNILFKNLPIIDESVLKRAVDLEKHSSIRILLLFKINIL